MPQNVSALLLAAGRSSRMGELKPLLPLGSSTLLETAAERFRRAGVEDVRVVVGHRAEEIVPVVERMGARWILNPDHERGMLSSVLAGARGLEPAVESFFLLPADIPLVKPRTIEALLRAGGPLPAGPVYPRFLGRRGHPPLIPRRCLPAEPAPGQTPGQASQPARGLRAFLARWEREAVDVDVADQGIAMDCDTPADYQRLQAYGRGEHIPTEAECRALWGLFRMPAERIAHSRQVADVACAAARLLQARGARLDLDLIGAAGCLHDLAKGQPDHAAAAARALAGLGYREVAEVVAAHTDIPPRSGPPGEAELVYLADKLVQGGRLVSLAERFRRPLARHARDPAVRQAVDRRLEAARSIQERIEAILGCPLEGILGLPAGGVRPARERKTGEALDFSP
jgi:CTP:molybdopterin cytidylyltransferase MocA